MAFWMGIVRNRFGVYEARKKVPKRLERPVAKLLDVGKERRAWLKKSLGTKDKHTASIRAKPVLMQFDQTLARAEALLRQRPLRTTLSRTEINRIADAHHAAVLARDDAVRPKYAEPEFIGAAPRWPTAALETSEREVYVLAELDDAEEALARGNTNHVSKEIDALLDTFQMNLNRESDAYRQLATAVLRAHVKAIQDIDARNRGQPIDTPSSPVVPTTLATDAGEKLHAAVEGWKKSKTRPQRTAHEYERAISMFIELHGDLPIEQIKRSHARLFREALQEVPRLRQGKMLKASLPELMEFGKRHPDVQKIGAGTVNKQLGALQAITRWARDNGIIPEDVPWADPFAGMRLEEDDADREPFTTAELRLLFGSPIFTQGERPVGGRGEAAFWLPLLGLFTGARQGELAGLSIGDVRTDEDSGVTSLFIETDRGRGRRLKTRRSERAVPVHSQLVRLGLLDYVAERRADGTKAWLFPRVAPDDDSGGVKAWSKWFGRYIRSIGITDTAKVFHSSRHNFKDALRAASVPEDVNDALMGQTNRSDVSRMYGAKEMVRRFGWKALVSAVESVAYPGLDLSRVHRRGQRKRRHR
jgi:integrase